MSALSIHHRPRLAGLIPEAFVLVPRVTDGAPPVVAVHGIQREAAEMASLLVRAAEETGRTIVLPLFERKPWRRFQQAACPARSDWALLRLLAALKAEGRIAPGAIDLSGYSGGAQFAHRFTWLYPQMVRRLCATAPGWWTYADPGVAYPYGIGTGDDSSVAAYFQANLKAFLSREIIVRVGALDTLRDDKLRVSPELDHQQGLHRVERAERWVRHIEAARAEHGLPASVDFRILPDCAHSFSDCVAQAGLDMEFVVPSGSGRAAFPSPLITKEVA
ncbi:MAG: hypothetical protein AAF908_04745 [Pseudomonadota bacterium]